MRRAFIFLSFLALICGTGKHTCNWPDCPYKGIANYQYNQVAECEEGSDCYYIGKLHLEYPDLDSDSLETLLFTPTTDNNAKDN